MNCHRSTPNLESEECTATGTQIQIGCHTAASQTGTQSQRGGTTNKRKLSLEVLAGESSPVNRVALAPPEAAADCEELQRQNAELCAKLEEASACMAEASLRFDEEAQEQLAVRQVCARATAVCWGWCMV